MAFEHFCPECLETRVFESVFIVENYTVKNEVITIDSHYFKCKECGELILNPDNEDENYITVYKEYRKRKNLLFPEEIIELRNKYDISQRQLAKILGWSHVTLSRYETGALQSQSHNNELVLLQEPKNMLTIIERNKENLTKQEYEKIKCKVEKLLFNHTNKSLYTYIENSFIAEPPSEYNGFTRFNLEKLTNVVRYFLYRDSHVYKVKLMKYLWYSDFIHFKNFTLSITGLKYSKLPMGPVPGNHDMLISLLLNVDQFITREYIDFGNGQGELFSTNEDFDPTLFTEEEMTTLEKVSNLVRPYNSKTISELSHKELAWQESKDREFITYKYAEKLNLS